MPGINRDTKRTGLKYFIQLSRIGPGRSRPGPVRWALLPCFEVGAAILLPARFVRFSTLRAFLAIADRLQTICRYTQLDEEFTGCGCTAIAETEVIFGRAALVAMPFHDDYRVGILRENRLEHIGIAGQCGARIFPNVALVVVEEGIAHIALQDVRKGPGGSLRRRRRRR